MRDSPFAEVVVDDNGSTDRTLEICARFPNVPVVVGEFGELGATRISDVSLGSPSADRGDYASS